MPRYFFSLNRTYIKSKEIIFAASKINNVKYTVK